MKREEAIDVLEHLAAMYPKVEMSRKKAKVLLPSLMEMDYDGVMMKLSHFATRYPYPPTIAEIAVYPKLPNEHLVNVKKWQEEAGEVSEQTKRRFQRQLEKLVLQKVNHENGKL
ncbi:hypothetical protein [Oceanobacillus sp. Castelsardo]|uniref:hypothetical protein n=1 Tax=Oceanobacillus sp. Castelsardo TaxID=1851204 RepID=UPI0008388266|nr:hypothetical protein [Oceanobacillus sp. Castelsardo]